MLYYNIILWKMNLKENLKVMNTSGNCGWLDPRQWFVRQGGAKSKNKRRRKSRKPSKTKRKSIKPLKTKRKTIKPLKNVRKSRKPVKTIRKKKKSKSRRRRN